MHWLLIFTGHVILCLLPALCCRPKEYTTQDGQCCPMCHEGTVVIRHCTADSGTRCGPCANGTYMNEPNGRTVCFHCSVCNSVHGLFAEQPCKSTTNTVCRAMSGFFCVKFTEESSCETAQKHSVCTAGQRVKEPGTSRTDTVCENCPEGFFSQWGINCTAWTVCSETQVIVKTGNATEDTVCDTASRYHYGLIFSLVPFILTLVLLGMSLTRREVCGGMCCCRFCNCPAAEVQRASGAVQ